MDNFENLFFLFFFSPIRSLHLRKKVVNFFNNLIKCIVIIYNLYAFIIRTHCLSSYCVYAKEIFICTCVCVFLKIPFV